MCFLLKCFDLHSECLYCMVLIVWSTKAEFNLDGKAPTQISLYFIILGRDDPDSLNQNHLIRVFAFVQL